MSLAGNFPLIWFFILLINGAFLIMAEVSADAFVQTNGRFGNATLFNGSGFNLPQEINGSGTNSLLGNLTGNQKDTSIYGNVTIPSHVGTGNWYDPIFDSGDLIIRSTDMLVKFISFSYITDTIEVVMGFGTIPESFNLLMVAVFVVMTSLWVAKMVLGKDN